MLTFISDSENQTKLLGKKFSKILKKEDTLLLEGQLGAGKTTFVKGIAEGLNFKGRVLSPSFTLAREYKAKALDVYHLDLYRLRQKDLNSIDIESYLYSKQGACVVEWGSKLEGYLDRFLKISFLFINADKRKISITQKGYGKVKLSLLKV